MDVPMKRLCVLDDYQRVATTIVDWSALDGRVDVECWSEHVGDEDALAAALEPFHIIVAMRERTPFPGGLLERLPNLELLVTTGHFNAVIDLAAASDHGVTVCGTGGRFPPTAELTWGLILACVKQIPQIDRTVKAGGWQTVLGGDLAGARLGLVGLGRYGAGVARIGQAFGMDLVAWSQNLTEARCREVDAGVTLVSKAELFATSDVVTVHLVLSPRTTGLVGAPELAAMKATAYLVNTSRGPIVDEDALADALEVRSIAGAGIDVFGEEPLPADHPFRRLDNLVVSPHMGYVTKESYRVFYGDAVEDVVAYLDGSPIRAVQPAP